MKKIYILFLLCVTLSNYAQVPQGISYQAIALTASGTPVVSSNVRVRLSILDNNATGTVLYSETQLKTTNANGLFNLTIGQGTLVSGAFNTINWGANNKFLKAEMDTSGGTNYQAVGTTQLLSVPYAMAAGNLIPANGNSLSDEITQKSVTNFAFLDYGDNKAYVFNGKTGTWSNHTFNANSSPILIESKGNFSFIDNGDNIAYAFSSNSNSWSSQNFNPNSSPEIVISLGNFGFVDYGDNKVYVFNTKYGNWVSQTFNSNSSPDLTGTLGNFYFIDYGDNKVYAFNQNLGTWSAQSFNANSSPNISENNGSLTFIDYNDNKVYAFNAITGTWVSQQFNPNSSPIIISSPN